MKRIDSPTDVAITQFEGEPENTTQEIVLKVASAIVPPIALVTALRDHFSSKRRYERIEQVFLAFSSDIELLRKEFAENKTKTEAVEERLKSSSFIEALLTASEEAARTADSKKLERLASTLANGVNPDIIQPEDDLSSFVRDVSQLSETDIKTLKTIISFALFNSISEMTPSNMNSGEQSFLDNAARKKIENDDFYSTAYRLVGFGLALEMPSNTGRRSANDLRFNATNRGRKLIALLEKHTPAAKE